LNFHIKNYSKGSLAASVESYQAKMQANLSQEDSKAKHSQEQ
jgi:hypothetical protein